MRSQKFVYLWNKFIAIEKKFDVYSLKINDVNVWDHIRFNLYQEILVKAEIVERPLLKRTVEKPFDRLRRRIRMVKNFFFHNPLHSRKFEYIFINAGHSRRKDSKSRGVYDIWCDPIISYFGEDRCLLLENLAGIGRLRKPISTKNIVYTDVFNIYKKFCKNKHKIKINIARDIKNKISSIEKTIFLEFGVSVNIEASFLRLFPSQNWQSIMFRKILRKVRPKAVFLICSYGKEGYISACKNMKIPVIELQHGEISIYHEGYSYPDGGSKELFPDYLFTFGSYWIDNISLPISMDKCFSIGYPYLNDNRSIYNKIIKQRKILFLSVPYLGRSISKFAGGLRQILPRNWSIVYKLHPMEYRNWKVAYPDLVADGIDVVVEDEVPLYQLMAESSIQIGVFSTALYEGLAFNCKTYLINLPGSESMDRLVKKGYVSLIDRPEDVVVEIARDLKPSYNEIFSPNWQKNIDLAMSKIL